MEGLEVLAGMKLGPRGAQVEASAWLADNEVALDRVLVRLVEA